MFNIYLESISISSDHVQVLDDNYYDYDYDYDDQEFTLFVDLINRLKPGSKGRRETRGKGSTKVILASDARERKERGTNRSSPV